MEKYKIYCLTFPNGKKYIGQTKQDIQKRWLPKNYKYNKEMYQDIQNFGWGNIEKEVLEEVKTKEEAVDREEYYISLYKTLEEDKGYNKAHRCSGCLRVSREAVIKEWETGKTVKQIVEDFNCSRSLIGRILTDAGIGQKERRQRGHRTGSKVAQYTLDNELIAEYESLTEAEEKTGYSNRSICQCCLGKVKTAYGYIWRYIEKE